MIIGEVKDDGDREMREMGLGCRYVVGLGGVSWIGGEWG